MTLKLHVKLWKHQTKALTVAPNETAEIPPTMSS